MYLIVYISIIIVSKFKKLILSSKINRAIQIFLEILSWNINLQCTVTHKKRLLPFERLKPDDLFFLHNLPRFSLLIVIYWISVDLLMCNYHVDTNIMEEDDVWGICWERPQHYIYVKRFHIFTTYKYNQVGNYFMYTHT